MLSTAPQSLPRPTSNPLRIPKLNIKGPYIATSIESHFPTEHPLDRFYLSCSPTQPNPFQASNKKYINKKYRSICLFCPVSFQAEEVILIQPKIYFHILEYQEIIPTCLQKICYHNKSTYSRPSTNNYLLPD